MNNDSKGCFICGEDNNQVIQEHHIVPRRHDGSDNSENIVRLCANCHQAVEKIYDKDFYEEIGVINTEEDSKDFEFTGVPSIYLAGVMDWDSGAGKGIGSEDSHWRSSITNSQLSGKYNIITPYDRGLDHGGGSVEGIVEKDLELIDEADCLLAFIKRNDQVGTITEIFHALETEKPVLVIFETTVKGQSDTSAVIKSGVGPKFTDNQGKVIQRHCATHYWFLWNYLTERSKKEDLVKVQTGSESEIKTYAERWLQELGASYNLYKKEVTQE